MTGRRRRDGDHETPRDGDAQADGPRVQGAWTTPAVVVRRPDGSVVEPDETRRTRPRPRRIPGAPGAVLLRPTLSDATGGREERRRRRTNTPLPQPRPAPEGAPAKDPPAKDPPAKRAPAKDAPAKGAAGKGASAKGAAGKGASAKGTPAKGAAGKGTSAKGTPAKGAAGKGTSAKRAPAKRAPTATPAGAAHMKAPRRSPAGDKAPRRSPVRRVSASRGSRRPTSTRPGDRRARRVRQALARLDVGRLLPADQEARARRSLRLRRIGFRLAAAALALVVVYGVFPVRTWINQRAAEERARERQEVFDREIDLLEDEVRDLGRDERIEEEARELDFVLPGEESYRILPAPDAPPAGSTTTTTSTTEPTATAPEP